MIELNFTNFSLNSYFSHPLSPFSSCNRILRGCLNRINHSFIADILAVFPKGLRYNALRHLLFPWISILCKTIGLSLYSFNFRLFHLKEWIKCFIKDLKFLVNIVFFFYFLFFRINE